MRNPRSLLSDAIAHLRARWQLRGARALGERARVWGSMSVTALGELVIGSRARIVSTIVPVELFVGEQARMEIGSNVYINYGCSIAALKHIRIGDHCSIGTYAIIMDNNFHRVEPDRRDERPESAPVILEENVWLGARVIVLPGVTIGRDSVVAAGSIVTRDIPPRSLAAGNPARVIRTL